MATTKNRSVAFRQDMLRALREAATAEGGGHDVGVGWGEEDGEGFLKRTLAFGPRNVGANVLARYVWWVNFALEGGCQLTLVQEYGGTYVRKRDVALRKNMIS